LITSIATPAIINAIKRHPGWGGIGNLNATFTLNGTTGQWEVYINPTLDYETAISSIAHEVKLHVIDRSPTEDYPDFVPTYGSSYPGPDESLHVPAFYLELIVHLSSLGRPISTDVMEKLRESSADHPPLSKKIGISDKTIESFFAFISKRQ
jgi:hypothetical protein